MSYTLHRRHNERDDISNQRRINCLLSRLFRRKPKKTSMFTSLCEENPPVTGRFPSQKASNAENVSISWRHHGLLFVSTSIKRLFMIFSFLHSLAISGNEHKSSRLNTDHHSMTCGISAFNTMHIIHDFELPNDVCKPRIPFHVVVFFRRLLFTQIVFEPKLKKNVKFLQLTNNYHHGS